MARQMSEKKISAAAQELGRLGGYARGKVVLERIPPEDRRRYAQNAARCRWEAQGIRDAETKSKKK